METLKTLMLCLCLPAAVMAVLVVGHGIFTVLMRTISPLEAWANRQIRQMEEWQEDEEEWTR